MECIEIGVPCTMEIPSGSACVGDAPALAADHPDVFHHAWALVLMFLPCSFSFEYRQSNLLTRHGFHHTFGQAYVLHALSVYATQL